MNNLQPLSSFFPEIKVKEHHYDDVIELRNAYERAMFDYIEKYVLDGRNLGEIFPVAHISAVNEVMANKYMYGLNVLEHIIEYEDYFSDKEEINERYDDLVARGLASPMVRN